LRKEIIIPYVGILSHFVDQNAIFNENGAKNNNLVEAHEGA
jgi:hypothetical protein